MSHKKHSSLVNGIELDIGYETTQPSYVSNQLNEEDSSSEKDIELT
jgi:hypothetical protein